VGKNRGDSIGTVTRLWFAGSGARIAAGERGPYSAKLPDFHWGPPDLLRNCYRCSFPMIKRPGREVDYSPSSNAAVKNDGSYTSTPPICLHSMKWDNVTLIVMGKLQAQRSL